MHTCVRALQLYSTEYLRWTVWLHTNVNQNPATTNCLEDYSKRDDPSNTRREERLQIFPSDHNWIPRASSEENTALPSTARDRHLSWESHWTQHPDPRWTEAGNHLRSELLRKPGSKLLNRQEGLFFSCSERHKLCFLAFWLEELMSFANLEINNMFPDP